MIAAIDNRPRKHTASMALVAIWLSCAVVTTGCSVQKEVLLRCQYGERLQDVYSLDEKAKSVRLMSVNPPRPGSLVVSDSTYHLEFPENHPAEGYQLLKVDINRFTSKAEREIGRERTLPYQGQMVNLHPQFDGGECVRMEGGAL